MFNRKILTILSAFLIVLVLVGSSADEAFAKKKKKGSAARCSHSCAFTATKNGFTYSGVTTAVYNCRPWPSWGCGLLHSEALARISPTTLSGSWGVGCGNVHSFNVKIVSRPNPPTPTTGGGGGCSAGQYFCDVTGQCLNNGDSCNIPPGYEPFKINPDIPALIGPVKLRDALLGKPPIVNPGGTCVIDWSKEFVSYNKLTVCRFTAPGVDVEFAPGDEDAPLSASILNVRNDTPYKLVCSESDSPIPPEESEGVCRLNWDYKEIN